MQNFYRIRHSSSLLKGLTAGILPLILTTLLIFTFVIPASATDGQTINNTRISIMAEDMSIKAIFNIIFIGFRFMWNPYVVYYIFKFIACFSHCAMRIFSVKLYQ